MKNSFRTSRPWLASILALLVSLTACSDRVPLGVNGPGDGARTRVAAQDDLFTLVSDAPLTRDQSGHLAEVRTRHTTAQVHVARLSGEPGRLLGQGRAVILTLAPDKRYVALGKHVAKRGDSNVSWSGPLQGVTGWTDLVLTDKGVTGVIQADQETYSIQPLGGGLHAIARVDRTKLPPAHPPRLLDGAEVVEPIEPLTGALALALAQSPASLVAQASTDNPSGIWWDVLVVYTPSVAAAYYDISGLIQLAMDQTNQSYVNSNVYARVGLAGSRQVNYSESGRSYSQHLSALQSIGDGLMDEVPALRNSTVADVVVLLVNDGEACGQAAAILASRTNAYAAVHHSCIGTNTYTFQHEIGHLQGARHDRYVDGSSTPYQYGHGFVAPTGTWRTIMAYGNACGNCAPVNYWSNPNITYPPTGQAMGTVTSEDNARVLNNTARTIRDLATLPNPQNVAHANPGVPNALPSLTWTAVPGAEYYVVQGCMIDNGSYYFESCFSTAGTPYANSWSVQFSPRQTGSTNGSYNCPRIVMFRVRSYNRTGQSDYGYQVNICVY